MKEDVIAIFDIGKTNKKILLFNTLLKLVEEKEERFPVIKDEDGFECDDIDLIESWIKKSVTDLARSEKYDLKAVNFATYGATLVYIDGQGKRLTPVYNYLKPIDSEITDAVYEKYGGVDEFCRRTASPALGMLNSGFQALWLKRTRPDIFSKVKYILHFPQYLSYILTGAVCSEHTSIGCHTALWDFDKMDYHPWVRDEGLKVPYPVPVNTFNEINIDGRKIKVGIGIHDSSASLAPYFSGQSKKFMLLSTGTWCINMNPFNPEVLTPEQLACDCLCYMSISMQPVKSSRLFLGHMHETALKKMSEYFKIHENSFRLVKPNAKLLFKLMTRFTGERIFIKEDRIPGVLKEDADLFIFDNFIEGYHQLMVELSDIAVDSINLVVAENDDTECIFITGGFAKNPLFIKLVASSFPDKKVYISEINNATALGAACVMMSAMGDESQVCPDLGLSEVKF
jgi:sugar (pentulose or hexulose) kinase